MASADNNNNSVSDHSEEIELARAATGGDACAEEAPTTELTMAIADRLLKGGGVNVVRDEDNDEVETEDAGVCCEKAADEAVEADGDDEEEAEGDEEAEVDEEAEADVEAGFEEEAEADEEAEVEEKVEVEDEAEEEAEVDVEVGFEEEDVEAEVEVEEEAEEEAEVDVEVGFEEEDVEVEEEAEEEAEVEAEADKEETECDEVAGDEEVEAACNEGGEEVDDGGYNGEDGTAEAETEKTIEAVSASVLDVNVKSSPGGLASNGKFNFGACSLAMRKVIGQLSGMLTRRKAAAHSAEADADAETTDAEVAAVPAERALRRINRLRLRHPQCRPLALNDAYSDIADVMAKDLVAREAKNGLTEQLLANAESSTVEFPDGDQQLGIVISRMEVADFGALPIASVNHWYTGGELFHYHGSQDSLSQTNYRHFIQLVDGNSRRMGWAAAMANGAFAYAVCVFDNPAISDDKALGDLQPPISGINADDD